jgi:hypothetical protein
VDRDRVRFANTTQVEVWAVRVHAFVAGAIDGLLASVTRGVMPNVVRQSIADHKVTSVADLNKSVLRVLFMCDAEARITSIEIRAVHAFITVAADPRVAEVTSGVMNHRFSMGTSPRRQGGTGARSTIMNIRATTVCRRSGISFAVAAVDIMNIHTPWLLDFKELVEGVVSLSRAHVDARCA